MHIHIIGICGTFMGGIAQLARQNGHRVTGSDENVYPPMSEQLAQAGVDVMQGYSANNLFEKPDQVVIGNAMSRGNEEVEAVLNSGLNYCSGPEWLARHVLDGRTVLAVAGTHGKTTTASMLTWILESANLDPGFLIGGVPQNFGITARNGGGQYFVVEADEYDSAFFDKRSKFVHYRPTIAILNNLEFDHADIFENLAAIQKQFHHFVRTIPGNGHLIYKQDDSALQEVLKMGYWTPLDTFASSESNWQSGEVQDGGSRFNVYHNTECLAQVNWSLTGEHNVQNALAAIAAAFAINIPIEESCKALSSFQNVRRRMELKGRIGEIEVYDDFAHHPTAIHTTLSGIKQNDPQRRIIAILEPRSNTMRMGVHKDTLSDALDQADIVIIFKPDNIHWDIRQSLSSLGDKLSVFDSIESIIKHVVCISGSNDRLIVMSNGGFAGIHNKIIKALDSAHQSKHD